MQTGVDEGTEGGSRLIEIPHDDHGALERRDHLGQRLGLDAAGPLLQRQVGTHDRDPVPSRHYGASRFLVLEPWQGLEPGGQLTLRGNRDPVVPVPTKGRPERHLEAEKLAELRGLIDAPRAFHPAVQLLQRDQPRAGRCNRSRGSSQVDAVVESFAVMDVEGGDSQGPHPGRIDSRSCDHGVVDISPSEAAPGQTLEETTEYCYGHPKTPTRLHCTRCDRPICGRCAIPASVGQHCPECVAEARRSAPKVRTALRANAPAVYTILGINIGMFLLQLFTGGNIGVVTDALVMEPALIASGEWYRLFTPMIIHGGVFHLGLNCYVLYLFGPNVEQAFGTARFVVMYVVAGFMGSAFSFAFPPDNPSLGASGAIFGVAGILLVYLYKRRRETFIGPYLRNIIFFIVANLILGLTIFGGIVDNFAHFGGLIGGILLGIGFDQRKESAAPLLGAAMTISVIGIGVALIWLRITGAIF